MYRVFSGGHIEVITGPMFSGKSEELIKRIKTLGFAKIKTLAIKPMMDDRWEKGKIISRAGASIDTIQIEAAKEILSQWDPSYKAVAIDEAQFFGADLVEIATELANRGVRVIISCLDTDFAGKPFSSAPQLLAIAEFVTKLQAVCFKCGNAASKTHRKTDSQERVVVGDSEYEAMCRSCHTKALNSK
ncbi:thymidine kinase [Mycoplasma todarodis]|uniref:Thymidine kinase n=1 Tax=Mycoplasma todarodis TaxID=1937191 RepID=A0A4R0XIU3_9MOLU|nr:thymidine kinase [Mycoplasma todarodis]TCG10516.1 thymidine kinase [Mycoplasma todarodis]